MGVGSAPYSSTPSALARSRIPAHDVDVWPAFTDAMLAFVLVLILAMTYQVGQATDVLDVEEDAGEVNRIRDQQLVKERIEGMGVAGVAVPETNDVNQRITFGSDVTFAKASATLSPEGTALIATLAQTILGSSGDRGVCSLREIQVSGHTDTEPIRTGLFPSNWELSTARAVNIVKALTASGVDPDQIVMSATGYGEFQPADPRDPDPDRDRRIELRLTYSNSQIEADCQ